MNGSTVMRNWGAVVILCSTFPHLAFPEWYRADDGELSAGEEHTIAATLSSGSTILVPSSKGGLPFGPSKLPSEQFGELFTGTKLTVYPDSMVSTLTEARASGMRVFLIVVGPQRHYRSSDGTFNLDMWKARVDRFRDIDFGEFIEDETIVVHQLISEAKAKNQWGGTIIPNDVLDEMAGYSKEIWPTMATVVRTDASDLEEHAAGYRTPWPGWEWTYLDAAWSRYLARKGPVAEFADDEQTSADRQKLALVVSLNVFSGGDGSSAIPSPREGRWAMSPDELRLYGSTMLSQTTACAFGMWRYETPGSESNSPLARRLVCRRHCGCADTSMLL